MCYRPSWVAGPDDKFNAGTCPSCGMPVAAAIGTTAGDCPHCGKPITIETAGPVNMDLFKDGPKPII